MSPSNPVRFMEPFDGPTKYRLTRCLACGCEAHYRFAYTLDRNAADEPTCRACYWREWASETRRLQGVHASTEPVLEAEAKAHAQANGYDYLRPLTEPSLPDDPHHVRCRYCGRLSAQRLGDVGWGCQCQVNPRRDPGARKETTEPRKRQLLKDSGLPAVDWWDHDRNGPEVWATVTPKARRSVWWRCPECGHSFEKRVQDMCSIPECPRCEQRRRREWAQEYERHKNTSAATVPLLLSAWADEADPSAVMIADGELRRFECPRGHHPRVSPLSYLQSGCPVCRAQQSREQELSAIDVDLGSSRLNAEIAAQWHPIKNGKLDPRRISPNSQRMVHWYEPSCGHEWVASPAERDKRQRLRCPECRTILDSLAYHFPQLAEERSPANPVTAWHVRPSEILDYVPEWVCREDPTHVWTATLATRTSGSDCPMCREHGKSAIELAHFEAARRIFGNAASGRPMRSQKFQSRTVWHPDITVNLPDGRSLVIEYDGSYWHADKPEVDILKSRDLLAAGTLVVRLREHPLPPLGIESPGYLELTVYAQAPDPERNINEVARWINAVSAPA